MQDNQGQNSESRTNIASRKIRDTRGKSETILITLIKYNLFVSLQVYGVLRKNNF